MHIGDRIQKLLDKHHMTQCELAEAVYLNVNTINGYIRNRRMPDCEKAMLIAEYLDTSLDYLIGNKEPISTDNLASNEICLLHKFRALDDDYQTLLIAIAGSLKQAQSYKKTNSK